MRTTCKGVHYRVENKPSEQAYTKLYIVKCSEAQRDFRSENESLATIFAQWCYWQGYPVKCSMRYVGNVTISR
jgi:hypothetical protein